MRSYRIFTENRPGTKFQYFDKITYPTLNEPVLCLIHTDSYSADAVLSFQKLLSAPEYEKALKFRFLQDQHSYIITHAMLRSILGYYMVSEPAEIEFVSNDYGKPSLSEKYKKIHFNLSHSSGLSVLAISGKSEIGVDIEKIDPEFDFDQIAKVHFSNAENSFLHILKEESREKFYTLWTRKEAFLKAVGTGIGKNLGIEVFRKINHFKPEMPFPGVQCGDFYLKSFSYQDKYMISAANNYSGELTCYLFDL
ncbi:MAG: 4'-phosphopantetheinyl transferase superfamily protein [Bacteroidia bacterium]|nr:4'-phosphopantetheinyl transferase superfamily protein [Bacteroidia bacterium]